MPARLYVFPHAGGSAAAFRPWQGLVGDDVELRAVQLPGREALFKEPPLTSHADAVAYLRRTLVPQLRPPFAFYGHSMGGHLAFSVARELRALGLPEPVHLFVSAATAPRFGPPGPLSQRDDQQFVSLLRDLRGTPEEVLENTELLRLMLPLLRADFSIAETFAYVPEPPLACPISVFGGLDDVHPTERLAAWRAETTARFRLRMVPGGHFFIFERPELLVGALRDDLESSLAAPAVAT